MDMLKSWSGIAILFAVAIVLLLLGNGPITHWAVRRNAPLASAGNNRAGAAKGVPTLAAIGGAAALSGDTVRFGDMVFHLSGVTCPDPATEAGRNAKALANTFLRIRGHMSCRSWSSPSGRVGDCTARTVDGERKLSDVMLKAGYCKP